MTKPRPVPGFRGAGGARRAKYFWGGGLQTRLTCGLVLAGWVEGGAPPGGIVNLSSFGPPMDPWSLGWAAESSLEWCSGGCRGRARDLVPGAESGAHLAPVFLGG